MRTAKTAQADLSLRWAHMPFCWFCRATAHIVFYSSCGCLGLAAACDCGDPWTFHLPIVFGYM